MSNTPPLWSPNRNLARWGLPIFQHPWEELEALSDPKSGIYSFSGFPLPVDLLLRAEPGAPLFVFLHGNAPRSTQYSLPVFAARTVTENLKLNVLSISDPALALSDDLTLTWFSGTAELPVRRIVIDLIRHFARLVGTERIIICGGSGGGYATLLALLAFPQAVAMVWNPQTDILRYVPAVVAHFAKVCYGLEELQLRQELPRKMICDLCPAYASLYAGQKIIYVQNADDWHVTEHARPFFQSLNPTSPPLEKGSLISQKMVGEIFLYQNRWGNGHAQPPNAMVRAIVEFAREVSLGEIPFTDEAIAARMNAAFYLGTAPLATG